MGEEKHRNNSKRIKHKYPHISHHDDKEGKSGCMMLLAHPTSKRLDSSKTQLHTKKNKGGEQAR